MSKYVVMEVYSVEADSAEAAKAQVEGATANDSAVHVAVSLSGMLNPFHWADAQNKFGHIQPAPVEEVLTSTPSETPVTPEAPAV